MGGQRITVSMLEDKLNQQNSRIDSISKGLEEVKEDLRNVGIGAGAVTLKEVVDRHTEQIDGDGNGIPGLRNNVRELMQAYTTIKWMLSAITIAVIGMAVDLLVKRFFFKE